MAKASCTDAKHVFDQYMRVRQIMTPLTARSRASKNTSGIGEWMVQVRLSSKHPQQWPKSSRSADPTKRSTRQGKLSAMRRSKGVSMRGIEVSVRVVSLVKVVSEGEASSRSLKNILMQVCWVDSPSSSKLIESSWRRMRALSRHGLVSRIWEVAQSVLTGMSVLGGGRRKYAHIQTSPTQNRHLHHKQLSFFPGTPVT